MNRIGIISLLALGLGAFHARALEARQTPYDKITERNVFQLHDPPVTLVSTQVVAQLPKLKLTGITAILRRRLAFITIEGTKGRLAESVAIAEGETAGGIRVESVDERAGLVSVLNGGERQLLRFEPAKPSGQQFIEAIIMEVPLDNSRPPVAPVAAQAKIEPLLSREEQTALIELQRIKFQMEGNPAHALLPPTELNPNE